MENETITIAVVDDHPIVIEGLKQLLSGVDGLHIAGCFIDGNGILSFIRTNYVDVVLLDITLPDCNGIELCSAIKTASPSTSVLMLSNRSERSMVMQSLQNGASGYLLKNASLEELSNCIKEATTGNIVFCNEIKMIIGKPGGRDEHKIPKLTKRENEVLKMMADGKTTPIIADELCLSPLTIETHRKNIMQKFQAKNVAELILLAAQHNIL